MNKSTRKSKNKRNQRRAAKADLLYINDLGDGIRRQRRGKGFSYKLPSGKILVNKRVHQRIDALVIPPAWDDVIICPRSNGHIQAVGRDEAGRRQYIYHDRWQAVSTVAKFDRMHRFGELLPKLRRRISKDLNGKQLTRARVLAAVVRLLDKAHLRVGNQAYVKAHGAHGATTLLPRHVEINQTRIRLNFPGKSGQKREVELADAKVAKVVRQCAEVNGQFLFQYLDADGLAHLISSTDVNDALQDFTGDAITAKDFRTWWGSVTALNELETIAEEDTASERNRKVSTAVALTAKELGNTQVVCRSSYIHPGMLAAAASGELTTLIARLPTKANRGLTIAETRFLALLPSLEFT